MRESVFLLIIAASWHRAALAEHPDYEALQNPIPAAWQTLSYQDDTFAEHRDEHPAFRSVKELKRWR